MPIPNGRTCRAVVLLLVIALVSTGCARPKHRLTVTRQLSVSGTIHLLGKPTGTTIARIEALPASLSWNQNAAFPGGNAGPTVPWRLDLPLELRVVTPVSPLNLPVRKTVRIPPQAKVFRVWLEPPPGWQATPKEYRVTKPTRNLNFTLRPTASP